MSLSTMIDGVKPWDVGNEAEDMDNDVQPSDCIPGLLSGLFDWEEEEQAIRT